MGISGALSSCTEPPSSDSIHVSAFSRLTPGAGRGTKVLLNLSDRALKATSSTLLSGGAAPPLPPPGWVSRLKASTSPAFSHWGGLRAVSLARSTHTKLRDGSFLYLDTRACTASST